MSLFLMVLMKNKKCSEIVVASDDNLTFDFNSVSVRFLAWICSDSIYGACSENWKFAPRSACLGRHSKGDIIVFQHNKEYLVKRVEAVEGDLIESNGENLVVPEGGFYVLGDNGQCSYDSRYWEYPFVMNDDIVAKVILPTR